MVLGSWLFSQLDIYLATRNWSVFGKEMALFSRFGWVHWCISGVSTYERIYALL